MPNVGVHDYLTGCKTVFRITNIFMNETVASRSTLGFLRHDTTEDSFDVKFRIEDSIFLFEERFQLKLIL